MAITGTYKSSLENIQFLSDQVISLDKSYRMILRCLVNKNNSELGASLAEICRFTANAEPPLLRKGVSMRIHGTNRTIGLIPLDFIYQKKEKKHRWGKQESTFHITFKGLMAVLGCGISQRNVKNSGTDSGQKW